MRRHIGFAVACFAMVGCDDGSALIDGGPPLTCGPGTVRQGNECVLAPLPDAALLDAPAIDGEVRPDAAMVDCAIAASSEATAFALNPQHDNVQPNDVVASPLTPVWVTQLNGHVFYPIVTGGRVIVSVSTAEPNVRALDLETGSLRWGPVVFGNEVKLAYDCGKVFVLDTLGYLFALDAATGTRFWSVQILDQSPDNGGSSQTFDSSPVASGGSIYVTGWGIGGVVEALDEETGAWRWIFATSNLLHSAVAVGDGSLYYVESCDHLVSLDPGTGNVRWSHTGSVGTCGEFTPAVYGSRIWEHTYAQGTILTEVGAAIGTFVSNVGPAFHGDTAFVLSYAAGSTPSVLSAVSILDGTVRWTFSGDGQLCTSPVVAGGGGQVFVASQMGNVYEIDEGTGRQISVNNVGMPVTCADRTFTHPERDGMTLAAGHLLVPVGDQLVVY